MTHPNRYAIIKNGTILNVIQLEHKEDGSDIELGNQISKSIYGDDAYIVYCGQYMCGIDDIYDNGQFYTLDDNGDFVQVYKEPTDKEEFELLMNQNESSYAALADIIGGAV